MEDKINSSLSSVTPGEDGDTVSRRNSCGFPDMPCVVEGDDQINRHSQVRQ